MVIKKVRDGLQHRFQRGPLAHQLPSDICWQMQLNLPLQIIAQ
jgi:hypothetical protein